MDAGKVKDDIEATIAYNNAKEINIQIDSEGKGLVTPNGSVSKKIGYEFEVQFKPDTQNYTLQDKNYIFEAVNYYDRTQSLDDYVTYYPAEQKEEDKIYGIYRQKIKINKDVTGLCLRPKCNMLPVITQNSPDYTANGVFANQPIKVTFSMPMEAADITKNNSIFNFKNIKITYKGQDVSDWFYAPVFNADKTVLTIAPKGRVIKDYIEKNLLTVVDVDVVFSEDLYLLTEAEEKIPFKQNEKSSFTVCYNTKVEENAPEMKKLFFTREPVTLENAALLPASKKFVEKLVKEQLLEENPAQDKYLSEDEIMQNRVKDFMYVYGTYYDAESGVREVVIKEQCTNDRSYKAAVDEPVIMHNFDEASQDAEFYDNGEGLVSFVIKCPVESIDGAVLVNIGVMDACGNETNKDALTVFKKSSAIMYIESLVTENIPYEILYQNLFTYDYYINNYKNLKIYGAKVLDNGHAVNDKVYGSWIDVGGYKITAEYIDKTGNVKKQQFTKCSPQDYLKNERYIEGWCLDLDVDNVAGLEVKVFVEDDIGNIDATSFSFPVKCSMTYKTTTLLEDKSGRGHLSFSKTGNSFISTSGEIQNGEERYEVPCTQLEGSGFFMFGDIAGPFKALSNEELASINAAVPEIGNVNTTWVRIPDNSENCGLKIEIDNWNSFDRIMLGRTDYYPNIVLEYPSTYVFSDLTLGIIGIKGNAATTKTVTVEALDYITDPSVLEYDNKPPVVRAKTSDGRYNYNFELVDSGIGPKNAVITLNNGKQYTIDSDSNFTCSIPKYEMNVVEDKTQKIGTYVAYDKANRAFSGELSLKWYNNFMFDGVESSESANLYKLFGRSSKKVSTTIAFKKSYLNAQNEWGETSSLSTTITETEETDGYKYTTNNIYLPADTFVRIDRWDYYSAPLYYYTGTKSSGEYDYVFREDATGVVVVSDADVYAHTMYVNRPYEDCCDWTANEWELYGKGIGDTVIAFEASEGFTPKRYTVPLTDIPSGACYAVVFHFATENTSVSAVSKAYKK